MPTPIPNVHRGRFDTVERRAQALILNDGGWLGCRSCDEWQDAEVGSPCRVCETELKAERRPDKGSRFEAYYIVYAEEHGLRPMRVKDKNHRNELVPV